MLDKESAAGVGWLASLLPPGGQLLDLGCGPGLYTARLAQRGCRVTGMDYARRSIAYAQAHDALSRYLCQDYLTLEAEDAFDAITLISCDYGALISAERQSLLSRVYRALKPGGRFIFDVFTPVRAAQKEARTEWSVHPDGGYWSASPTSACKPRTFTSSAPSASINILCSPPTAQRITCFGTPCSPPRAWPMR